jgi:hypothetical protein
MSFDRVRVRCELEPLSAGSEAAGRAIAKRLTAPDLKYLMVFTEGLNVHAQALVEGLLSGLPPGVIISGGLAGDQGQLARTLVCYEGATFDNHVVAAGFYGDSLRARCATASGWQPFGKPRVVTRANRNVVYEIDGVKALDVYQAYLGPEAEGLPASGLVFPISVHLAEKDEGLIRSLSAVDRNERSLTFFGAVPEGSVIHLMNAGHRELFEGAELAAQRACFEDGTAPGIALLFSCAGRKAVLGKQVDLELDAVCAALPGGVPLAGFYTFGEIGYYRGTGQCEHHNQTMTVTLLSE